MSIVTMEHVSFVVVQQEYSALLMRLMHLGCVELHTAAIESVPPLALRSEEGELSRAQQEYQLLIQATEDLRQIGGVRAPLLQKRREVAEKRMWNEGELHKALRLAEEIRRHAEAVEHARRGLAKREELCAALIHWTPLDLPLAGADTEYTQVVLQTLPVKINWKRLQEAVQEDAPESVLVEVSRTRERRYAALLCHRVSTGEALRALAHVGGRSASLGEYRRTARQEIEQARREQEELRGVIAQNTQQLRDLGAQRPVLELALDQAWTRLALEEARALGLSDGTVVLLEGWMPVQHQDALEKVLQDFACAVQERPPQQTEQPPTLLRNPKWMRPINVVTEMYSLPDYRGIDPNPLIFWFYIFFFGFMFADVAYGLILTAVAAFVRKKWDPQGALGQLMGLGVYLGLSTFVCGLLTGGFFGNAIEVVAGTFFGRSLQELPLWVQRFSAGFVFSPLTAPMTVLYTTLIIGVIQLLFGQFVHIYMEARNGHPWDGLLDTAPWWVFFAGIALWLLRGSAWLFLIGVLLLVLTQGRKRKSLGGKLAGGLASLYSVTNWLSDVLSYSRLMALMLATSVIATVINTLGALPGSLIAFIPVFLIGHLFNIAVNLIGTYVHAARLQYLEFYGRFYKEGGVPFRPLSYRTKYTQVRKEETL